MLPNVAALSLDRINEEGMLWETLPEDLKQAVAEQVFKTGNPDCMKPRILGKLFVANSEKLLIYAYRNKRVQSLTAALAAAHAAGAQVHVLTAAIPTFVRGVALFLIETITSQYPDMSAECYSAIYTCVFHACRPPQGAHWTRERESDLLRLFFDALYDVAPPIICGADLSKEQDVRVIRLRSRLFKPINAQRPFMQLPPLIEEALTERVHALHEEGAGGCAPRRY